MDCTTCFNGFKINRILLGCPRGLNDFFNNVNSIFNNVNSAFDTVDNGGDDQSTVVAVAPGFNDGLSAHVESSKPSKRLSVKLDDQSTSGKKSPQSPSPAPAQKVIVEDKKPARRRKPKRDPSDIRVVMEKGHYRRKAKLPSPEMKVKLEKSTPKRVDSPPAATTADIPAQETAAPIPTQNDKKEIPKFDSIRPEALAYIKGTFANYCKFTRSTAFIANLTNVIYLVI